MKAGSVFPATMPEADKDTTLTKEQAWYVKYRTTVCLFILVIVGIVIGVTVGGSGSEKPIADSNDGEDDEIVVVIECPSGFEPYKAASFAPKEGPCKDINECLLNTDNCGDDKRCRNLPGSFECLPCKGAREVPSENGLGCMLELADDDVTIDAYNECPVDTYPGALKNNYRLVGMDEEKLSGLIAEHAEFGTSLTFLGDLDRDGVDDLAVSAWTDDGGGTERGAVYVVLMAESGDIKAVEKISSVHGGLESHILDNERFGKSIVGLGDLDGDGIRDMLVASHAPEALYVLFLEPTGSVKNERKITTLLEYGMNQGEDFGRSMAAMGDMNGDGNPDVAVGMPLADERRGAVILLFLDGDGTVRGEYVIGHSSSQLTDELDPGDEFGTSIAPIGDFDGNGTPDIVVGAVLDDDGGNNRGAVYVLTLNPDWTVKASQKISSVHGGLAGPLSDGDSFGHVGTAGDLDGDGVMDLLVGAIHDWDDNVISTGAVYVLLLDSQGSVKKEQKISRRKSGLTELLDDNRFGMSPTVVGYLGDGSLRVAVGTPGVGIEKALREENYQMGWPNEPDEVVDDSGLVPVGAMYMLELHACTPVDVDECALGRDNCPPLSHMCRNTAEAFECVECPTGQIESVDGLSCIPNDGDIDECVRELDHCPSTHACFNTEGSYECRECPSGEMVAEDGLRCITDVCFQPVCEEPEETCVRFGDERFVCEDFCTVPRDPVTLRTIDATSGRHAKVEVGGKYATDMDIIGDVDGDGNPEVAVGMPGSETVYIMFYDTDYNVKTQTRIYGYQPKNYNYGTSVAALGDIDRDGVVDIAVGTPNDDDGDGNDQGAVYVVFLTERGRRKREVKISSTRSGLKPLATGAQFGAQVTGLGDLDEDGVGDMAVGAVKGRDGGGDVTVVFLNDDGTVKGEQRISSSEGGFTGTIATGDAFYSVNKLRDLNGDGIVDLGVGATGDGGGSLYLLMLNRDGTVQENHKLGADTGSGITRPIQDLDVFGRGVASVGDINQDGVMDLAVSVPGHPAKTSEWEAQNSQIGSVYVFLMNPDFTVKAERLIGGRDVSSSSNPGTHFGSQLVDLGDVNGNGAVELGITDPWGPTFQLGRIFVVEVPRGIMRECPF